MQTLVPNKFLGHGIVIGFFILIPVLYRYGFENRLALFGEITPYTYSDMNGYGHFVPALFWSITYWLTVGGLLGVIAIVMARRGSETSWKARFHGRTPNGSRGLIPAAVVLLARCHRQRRLVLLQHPPPQRIPDRKTTAPAPGRLRKAL